MFATSSHIIWGEIETISGNSQSNSDNMSRVSGSNESASRGKELMNRHLLMDVEIRKSSDSIRAGSSKVQNNLNIHDAGGGDDMWNSTYGHLEPDFGHILFGSSSGSSSSKGFGHILFGSSESSSSQDAFASQSATRILPRPNELLAGQIETISEGTNYPSLELFQIANQHHGPPEAVHAESGPDAPLMSIGSALHWKNECKPCLFAYTKMTCVHGASCQFCHFAHTGKSKPSKAKRNRYRRLLQERMQPPIESNQA